jgi:hypothetical protein
MMPVPPRVASVTAQPDFRLVVVFEDGLSGTVDCRDLILGERAGVFAQLRDDRAFRSAHVEYGAVTWDGELDLAPDAMYEEIRQHGEWVVA